MRNTLTFFIASCIPFLSMAQGRMVLSNNAYVVIDNAAYVVIDNAATNAITTTGTGGNIVTENEFDRVKWNIGTNTGTYIMPFTSATGVKIPFTVSINTAGTGAGSVLFSTYSGSTWDNNTYRPSDVTHMFDYYTASFNNSPNVIDRFWIIDASGYSTRPSAMLDFTYIDAEHTPVGNVITEADLGAQRFNNSLNIWGDYLPVGTINTVDNTVSSVPAFPADFFRSWTLSEFTSPLSIQLTAFHAVCNQNNVNVTWSTATEINSRYFYLEASPDGIWYDRLYTLNAAGNSVTQQNYQAVVSPGQYVYYRLVLENTDGSMELFPAVFADCLPDHTWAYTSPITQNFMLQSETNLLPNAAVYVTDVSGKILETVTNAGSETRQLQVNTQGWSNGMYLLVLVNGNERKEFKLILSR